MKTLVLIAALISTPQAPPRDRPYFPARMLAYHDGRLVVAVVDGRGVIVRYEGRRPR